MFSNADKANSCVYNSAQHLDRVGNGFAELLQKFGGYLAVIHPVVSTQGHCHACLDHWLAILHDNMLHRAPNRHDTCLRGVDDGTEPVDAIHSKVGDAE